LARASIETLPTMPVFYKLLLFFLVIASPLALSAQNTPCTAIPLPNNMTDFQTFSTAGLSNSGVPYPGCGAPVGVDIWFSVVAPPSGDVDIATLMGTMVNAAMAVYAGPCNNLTLIACADDDNCGGTIMPAMQFGDLTPGQTYYIRIWPEGGGGSFDIRITDGDPQAQPLNMALTGSASQNGPNCIQLTPAQTAQAGAAYLPNPIDFTQPFTDTKLLNFGTNDPTGADGICMIYHNDPAGTNALGIGGGGIGVEGIQNSFIIEFDTYDNGPGVNDLPADHIAVSVNGVIATPIQGPIGLPNIEDGQDHEVSFSWDPATNNYSVSFDGIPYVNGNYDIINNCFGGLTTAYCGFTASTGGAVNVQTVCNPTPPIIPAGWEFQVEAEICQGETYFAGGAPQSVSGTYFDFFSTWHGCDSIIVTNLTVLPAPTTPVVETVCAGECVTIGGVDYCTTGVHQEVVPNWQGCDSTILLNLTVLEPQAVIDPPAQLDCNNTLVTLNGSNSTFGPGMEFQWTGPNPGCIIGSPNTAAIAVNCPGTYTLTITHSVGALSCSSTTSVDVTQNVEVINLNIVPPAQLTCAAPCQILDASGSTSGSNYTYSWTGPNSFTSDELSPEVCNPGTYTLTIENPSNGCQTMGSVTVDSNIDIPAADAGPDATLNCAQPEWLLSTSGNGLSIEWQDDQGTPLSQDTTYSVQQSGTYILVVTDPGNGCSAQDTVEIDENFDTPTADAGSNQELDCAANSVTLDGSNSSSGANISYVWTDEDGNLLGSNPQQDVSTDGTFYLTVSNSASECTAVDSVLVQLNADAPIADPGPEQILTCLTTEVTLDGTNSSVGPDISYAWLDAIGTNLGSSPLLITSSPGTYWLIVSNSTNNCVDSASVDVLIDQTAPPALAGPDTLVNCYLPQITLGDSGDPGFQYEWEDEQGQPLGTDPLLDVSNAGVYFLSVVNPANGCQSQDTVIVTADQDIPVATAGPDGLLTCLATSFDLDGSSSSSGLQFAYTWVNSQGDTVSVAPSFSVTAPDTFQLNIFNVENGCQNSDEAIVEENTEFPVALAGPDSLINCFAPEISITGSGNGASGTYQYTWSDLNGNPLATQADLSINQPGTYIFTVEDDINGCIQTDTLVVAEDFLAPDAEAGADATLDCNANSVTLDGSGSDQGPDITYQWTNANGSQVGDQPLVDIDQAGWYYLTLTNQINGCTAQDSAQVLLDANAPIALAGPNDTLNCVVNLVTLDGQNSSQGPDFSAEWTDETNGVVSTDYTFTTDIPGAYTLSITDLNNGCVSTSTAEVILDTLPPLVDAGLDNVINCFTPTVPIGTAGMGNWTFSWTDDQGNPISNQAQDSVNLPGVYQLLVTDPANGCTAVDAVTISEDLLSPLISAGMDQEINCFLPTTTLQGSGPTGNDYTYTWTDENGQVYSTQATPTVDQPGTYTLEVIDLTNGCSSTDEVIISENFDTPTASGGPDQLINCDLPTTTLTGSNSSGNNLVFEWLDPNDQFLSDQADVDVSQSGTYDLTVIDTLSGCSASISVEVEEDFVPPTAEAGASTTLNCFSPTQVVSAAGSSTGSSIQYQWTDPQQIPLGADLLQTVDMPGQYQITVLNLNNGCTATDSVLVLENFDTPTADAGSDAVLTCTQTATSLDGSGSTSGMDIAFTWTDLDGMVLGNNSTLPIDQSGTFVLEIQNTTSGCIDQDTVVVTVDQAVPNADISQPEILTCLATEVALDASSSTPGLDIDWNTVTGGIIQIGADPLLPTIDSPGLYQLILTDPANGCADTTQVEVLQDIAPPQAIAEGDVHLNCFQAEANLDATASQPAGQISYSWTTLDGQILSGADSPDPLVDAAGTYTLLVTNLNNGCEDESEVTVTASFLEEVAVSPISPLCFGETGGLVLDTVIGGVPPYLYSIDGGVSFAQQTLYTGLEPGAYTWEVQDADGCTITTPVLIEAPEQVVVEIDAEVVMRLGEEAQLIPQTNVPTNEIDTIFWSPALGLSCTDCLEPTATPPLSLDYTVTITNSNGCQDEATVRVIVDKRPQIYIANIFSPNEDGNNDRFFIQSDDLSIRNIESFRIFTRWGEQVFSATNFPPNDPAYGWDGIHRGQEMNAGVYVWMAEIELSDGSVEVYKGDVTLAR
jgi:gliding motility-associated-like protein